MPDVGGVPTSDIKSASSGAADIKRSKPSSIDKKTPGDLRAQSAQGTTGNVAGGLKTAGKAVSTPLRKSNIGKIISAPSKLKQGIGRTVSDMKANGIFKGGAVAAGRVGKNLGKTGAKMTKAAAKKNA